MLYNVVADRAAPCDPANSQFLRLCGSPHNRNNWVVLGSETGGRTAAVLYTLVLSCKHLGIDPFAYLREALMGLFALGEEPAAEHLSEWLPDRWLLRQSKGSSTVAAG